MRTRSGVSQKQVLGSLPPFEAGSGPEQAVPFHDVNVQGGTELHIVAMLVTTGWKAFDCRARLPCKATRERTGGKGSKLGMLKSGRFYTSSSIVRVSSFFLLSVFIFRVSGFRLQVSGCESRVSGSGLQVSGFGAREVPIEARSWVC